MNELEQFRDYLILRDRSPATIRKYLCIVNLFVNQFHGNIAEFKQYASKFSDSHRNACICAVKVYYRFIGQEIDTEVLSIIRVRDTHKTLIPPQDVQSIVDLLKPHHRKTQPTRENIIAWRNYCIVGLLAYTGIRNMELRKIAYKDIDFNNKEIYITGIKREQSRLVYPIPKLFNAIETYVQIAEIGRESLLFPVESNQITTLVRSLTGYRPKDFRTTFATEYYDRIRDIKLVQRSLGHLSVVSTEPYVMIVESREKKSSEVGMYEY